LTLSFGIRPPRYRLPDATRVGCVRLQVSDLVRSADYYQAVIGLMLLERSGTRAVMGPAGGHALLELNERRGATPVPPHGRLGLYHFALLVPDRASLGRFLVHLADADVRLASADHSVSEALYLWDPDGLGIEVYADRPRDAWRTHGSELTMTTDRLDLHDLARAAARGSWAGLPAGTVVGHVHLHVGALADAEAMYHGALGFDKVVWSYPGALFLSAGGYHHHLGVNVWAQGAPPAGEEDARLLEWELILPGLGDVEAAADSLTQSGWAVEVDGNTRRVADPWGIQLRLRADE
jgi:catechol 2,3-dioxygenase